MFNSNRFFFAKMYSLMEILIVFIIISVLTGLAFLSFRVSQTVISDDLANNVVESVALAQREYYLQRSYWLTDPDSLASFIPNTSFITPAVSPYDVSLVEEPYLDSSSLGIAVLTGSNTCLTLRLVPDGDNEYGSFEVSSGQTCSGEFA